jgi:hypothetical protein
MNTQPTDCDTARQLWVKILTRLGQLTGDTSRPPLASDSIRVLLVKILKTLNHE